MAAALQRRVIPLWLKVAYTAYVALLVPFYWQNYGAANFLWFSDLALLATVVALWSENRLLAGTMTVGLLLPEIVWNVAFFGRLLTGYPFGGMTGYMFDQQNPLFLRGLSLFHVFLPVVLLFTVWRLGYDSRGLTAMTLLAWVVLPITYVVSDPVENINWVLGIGQPQHLMPPLVFLGLLMLILPLLVYLPTHLILRAIFKAVSSQQSAVSSPPAPDRPAAKPTDY